MSFFADHNCAKRIPNEELKPGDVVSLWCGRARVLAIEPYHGPLKDLVFAIARVDTKFDFSLERGGCCEVIR